MKGIAPFTLFISAFLAACATKNDAPMIQSAEQCLAAHHTNLEIDLRGIPLKNEQAFVPPRLDLGKVSICLDGEKIVGIATNGLAEWSEGTAGSSYQLRYRLKNIRGNFKAPRLRLKAEWELLSMQMPGGAAPLTNLTEIDAYAATFSGALAAIGQKSQATLFSILAQTIDQGQIKPLDIDGDILADHATINGFTFP